MSEINSEFNRGLNFNAYRGTDYYTSAGGPFVFPATPISFNDFYGTQVSLPYTVSISGIPDITGAINSASTPGQPAICQINFFSDGTYTIQATIYSWPSGTWVTPVTAGVGNYYWIRFTQTGASGKTGILNGTLNTWLSLGATRQLQFVMTQGQPPGPPYSGTRIFTIDIATDSSGSNIVATKTNFQMTSGVL
jgi:hypothetical protein